MSSIIKYNQDNEDISFSDINENSNFKKLSSHRHLTIHWLLKFPNAKWDYQALTSRYNFNTDWIRLFPDKPWDYSKLSSDNTLSLKNIESIPNFSKHLDFGELSKNKNLNTQWLESYPEANWDMDLLACHSNIALDWFDVIPYEKWDFRVVSQNKKFPLALLENFPNADWDFEAISYHQNLNAFWFSVFKDREWDFDYLRETYFYFQPSVYCSQEIMDLWVLNFPEEKINFKQLGQHPYLHLKWLKAYPNAPWDFISISHRYKVYEIQSHSTHKNIFCVTWLQEFPEANWDTQALCKLRNFSLCWTLIAPKLYWDFSKISFDPLEVTLDFIKTFPDNELNNIWLRSNKFINEEWIPHIKLTEDNFRKLSYNDCMTLSCIKANSKAPWDWNAISDRKNITAEWIKAFPDKPWNFTVLSNKVNLDLLVLEILPHSPWVYESLSYNKNLKLKDLKSNRRKSWDFKALSSHSNFDISWIQEFKDKLSEWHFPSISQNKNLKIDWLIAFPDEDWDYSALSRHPRFTKQWYLNFADKPWDLSIIAGRKDMKSILVLLQYNYPYSTILDYQEFDDKSLQHARVKTQIANTIILQPQNYHRLLAHNQWTEIFIDALNYSVTEEEKENVVEVDNQKVNIYKIFPNLFFNPSSYLELTDLGGDSYYVPGWFKSKNIMKLIHETLPELGKIDIYVNSYTDKPDQLGSKTYSNHLKYLLFNNPNGPQAMIVYPETENNLDGENNLDEQNYTLDF